MGDFPCRRMEALTAFCRNPEGDPERLELFNEYDDRRLAELVDEALAEAQEAQDETLLSKLRSMGWDTIRREFEGAVDLAELAQALADMAQRGGKGSSMPKFIGIKFCQECNNMLYPEAAADGTKTLYYACRLCKFKELADNNCVFVNHITHEVDSLTQISTAVSADPTLPHTRGNMQTECPKCHHDDAVFFQTPFNREQADMRLFYVCCSCAHKWSDVNKK